MSTGTFSLTGVPQTDEPDSMRKVRDLHERLQDAVQDLNDKIAKLLLEREKDFLAAYRHHMYNVQKELQDAKKSVKEAKDELKNDNQIRSLKKERDWFQKSATRLDNLAEARKKDLENLQVKLDETRDDKTWLEKQLKTAKRQNKILTAELGMQLHRGMETNVATQMTMGTSMPMTAGSPMTRPHTTSSVTSSGLVLPPVTPNSVGARSPSRSIRSLENQDDAQDTIFFLKGTIRDLSDKIKDLKRKNKALSTFARTHNRKGEFEELFLKCVVEAKAEASRRRQKTAINMRKSKRSPTKEEIEDIRLATAPSLQDLTAADKRKIMERMLSTDEVFTALYDKTFPGSRPSQTTVMRNGRLLRI